MSLVYVCDVCAAAVVVVVVVMIWLMIRVGILERLRGRGRDGHQSHRAKIWQLRGVG